MTQEKNNFIIHYLPVLTDNIIWIWVKGNEAVVIDPAITEPVEAWLKKRQLNLKAVLQTHHHDDHIGGTKGLLKMWPSASVIAAKEDLDRIPFQTKSVSHGEVIDLMDNSIDVIGAKGHTKCHICYYLSDKNGPGMNPILFCGDTLFGGGCGRLFEGSPIDMFNSLKRINALPSNTKIYCAHEYTEQNLRWANSLFPEDLLIKARLQKVINRRANGLPSLPSNISEERKTNLFIRAKNVEELSQLRKHKDNWKG